ncbi:protein SULFUR DEFICIENCY-INDUCED 1-like [Wolffia australiana]
MAVQAVEVSAKAKIAAIDKSDLFHVVHKVPAGDSPYVRAKHLQLVDKDPAGSIVWFWKAINAGDRVDSALKDMAVVMKQLDRADEAVEAIKSFRHLCSKQSQESLDNVLIDLFKKCGRTEEQIELLKHKLKMIYMGEAFNGKTTKTARSHGKKFQVSIKQETSRILGNLGWAYMQQKNYLAAEVVYRKAQEIEPDANKACNLSLCLVRQHRRDEARAILNDAIAAVLPGSDDPKIRNRAHDLLLEIDPAHNNDDDNNNGSNDNDRVIPAHLTITSPLSRFRRRLPIFEEISTFRDHQVAC